MRIFGLIGYPLGHSFSSAFFADKFSKEGHNAIYRNYEISSLSMFKEIVESNKELSGLNVTIPYKTQIIEFLHHIDPVAAEIGAVNVINIFRENNRISLTGYNTDKKGFTESLKPVLRPGINSALILGTGGSSLAVRKGLEDIGIDYRSVSRDKNKGDFVYDQLDADILNLYPLIINTTPLGMFPDISSYPDIPYQHLTEKNILFDLVYNPELTAFLSFGKERGCSVKGGSQMLEIQAEEAWEIWNRQP